MRSLQAETARANKNAATCLQFLAVLRAIASYRGQHPADRDPASTMEALASTALKMPWLFNE